MPPARSRTWSWPRPMPASRWSNRRLFLSGRCFWVPRVPTKKSPKSKIGCNFVVNHIFLFEFPFWKDGLNIFFVLFLQWRRSMFRGENCFNRHIFFGFIWRLFLGSAPCSPVNMPGGGGRRGRRGRPGAPHHRRRGEIVDRLVIAVTLWHLDGWWYSKLESTWIHETWIFNDFYHHLFFFWMKIMETWQWFFVLWVSSCSTMDRITDEFPLKTASKHGFLEGMKIQWL